MRIRTLPMTFTRAEVEESARDMRWFREWVYITQENAIHAERKRRIAEGVRSVEESIAACRPGAKGKP